LLPETTKSADLNYLDLCISYKIKCKDTLVQL